MVPVRFCLLILLNVRKKSVVRLTLSFLSKYKYCLSVRSGHIAKAERMLQETFKAVDVVVEVRDARIAKATSHPSVPAWCAGRPRLVVLTHVDQIPAASRRAWQDAFTKFGADQANIDDNDKMIDLQIQNQAKQAIQERLKYTPAAAAAAFQKNNNNNKHKQQRQQQHQKRGSSAAASAASSIVNTVEDVLFVNAKMGSGIHALTRAIFKAGAHVQERRERRGLKERPLRVGIIGYPNVGKSALINRLLGRRRARTANTPGVTRSLQWIRVKSQDSNSNSNNKQKAGRKEFELLDSPGIIPATLVDQSDATLLAACNCIGDAAYDNQAVAAYLCEWLLSLNRLGYKKQCAPDWRKQCQRRYKFDPLLSSSSSMQQDNTVVEQQQQEEEGIKEEEQNNNNTDITPSHQWTGEDMLYEVADRTCQGNPEDAARKIIQDFRTGRMGLICLQVAPVSSEEKGQRTVIAKDAARKEREERQQALEEAQQERARRALETAKERGLELPPAILEKDQTDTKTPSSSSSPDDEVGKGMFEGW